MRPGLKRFLKNREKQKRLLAECRSEGSELCVVMLLLLLGLVILAGNTFGDWAGVLGISLLAVLLIGLFCSEWGKDSKAHGNWVNYWAEGGPDRDERRR